MNLSGGIVTPCNPLYPESRECFNLAINRFPCSIVFCYSKNDVIQSLNYVRKNNIPFRVRTGRHDYECNSNVTDGIVIDISNINYSYIHADTQTAQLGGGITSGKMYSDLIAQGFTAPSGLCGDVGFCGLSSCGGLGYATRYLGLSCDNLLEIKLIDYSGREIIASRCCNPKLFWAIRGGLASNFGIVISIIVKITPVTSVSVAEIHWDKQYFLDIMPLWQEIYPHADCRLTTNIRLTNPQDSPITFILRAQYFGSPEELKNLLRPLLKEAPYENFMIDCVPYATATALWGSECTGPRKFKASGAFVINPLSQCMFNALYNSMLNAPKNGSQFYEFLGMGGAVSNTTPCESAFFYGDAKYLVEIESVWKDDYAQCENTQWTNTMKKLIDNEGFGCYRGFTDFNLCDWANQYYGANYNNLRFVKSIYDPYNVFNFPQSIKPL